MFWDTNDVTYTTARNCLDVPLPYDAPVLVSLTGRILSYRKMGGVAFGHIVDNSDTKIQFCFNKRLITAEQFASWAAQPRIGDIVGLIGELGQSSTGEITVMVTTDYKTLQASGNGFPDKFHGMTDVEACRRKRWLQTAVNPDSRQVFRLRSYIMHSIRNFMNNENFMEAETPVLTPQASGAMAKPFVTHHNALDADLYLRIAPETYLKRMVAGGFDRVYEMGKQFRNEGIDPSHLQEFTSLEWYAAFLDYQDNLEVFRNMLRFLADSRFFRQTEDLEAPLSKLALWANAPVVTYRDVFTRYTGKSADALSAAEADELFKSEVRPFLIEPIVLIDYPAHLSPMAARKASDPATAEQWQFIVEGWEVVKCYTELTDAVLQRKLLEEQASQRAAGNEETMMIEEDFLDCMEHGMPPMSGCGVGIDRLISLLNTANGVQNLRDVVYFPTFKGV